MLKYVKLNKEATMGLIASDKGGGDFEIMDAGVYVAVCYCVVDLGTQHNPKWDQWQKKVMIGWEIPDERIDIEKDGEKKNLPRVISRKFTLSLSDKGYLKPFLESWRGQPFTFKELVAFDISKLMGVNCQLNVIHNSYEGKTYANVATAMPLMKGIDRREPENPVVYYSMEDHGLSIPDNVYDWQKKIIMESQEWNETGQQNEEWGDKGDGPPIDNNPVEDEQIPF
jgi:hypothetical protein